MASYVNQGLLLKCRLNLYVLADSSTLEDSPGDLWAAAEASNSWTEDVAQRKGFQTNGTAQRELGVEICCCHTNPGCLRSQLALGLPHVGPTPQEIGRNTHRDFQGCGPVWALVSPVPREPCPVVLPGAPQCGSWPPPARCAEPVSGNGYFQGYSGPAARPVRRLNPLHTAIGSTDRSRSGLPGLLPPLQVGPDKCVPRRSSGPLRQQGDEDITQLLLARLKVSRCSLHGATNTSEDVDLPTGVEPCRVKVLGASAGTRADARVLCRSCCWNWSRVVLDWFSRRSNRPNPSHQGSERDQPWRCPAWRAPREPAHGPSSDQGCPTRRDRSGWRVPDR